MPSEKQREKVARDRSVSYNTPTTLRFKRFSGGRLVNDGVDEEAVLLYKDENGIAVFFPTVGGKDANQVRFFVSVDSPRDHTYMRNMISTSNVNPNTLYFDQGMLTTIGCLLGGVWYKSVTWKTVDVDWVLRDESP